MYLKESYFNFAVTMGSLTLLFMWMCWLKVMARFPGCLQLYTAAPAPLRYSTAETVTWAALKQQSFISLTVINKLSSDEKIMLICSFIFPGGLFPIWLAELHNGVPLVYVWRLRGGSTVWPGWRWKRNSWDSHRRKCFYWSVPLLMFYLGQKLPVYILWVPCYRINDYQLFGVHYAFL